jgi:hypothetical protein
MSPEEAASSRESIRDFYTNLMLHGDEFIQGTTAGHDEVYIWRSLDEDSIDLLVNIRMRRAQKSGVEAAMTRMMVAFSDRAMEFFILGPRVGYTFAAYGERGFDIPGGKRQHKAVRRKKTVEGTVAHAATGSAD